MLEKSKGAGLAAIVLSILWLVEVKALGSHQSVWSWLDHERTLYTLITPGEWGHIELTGLQVDQ